MCLIKQGRQVEPRQTLEDVRLHRIYGSEDEKVLAHAEQLLHEFDLINCVSSPFDVDLSVHEEIIERLDLVMNEWTVDIIQVRGFLRYTVRLVRPVEKGLVCNRKRPICMDPTVETNSIRLVFKLS
jgi:hypothetical protein